MQGGVDASVNLPLQTKDGMKMGKSLGNVLEPRSLLRAYGADAVRFYFLKEIVFGQVLTSACAAFQHCPVLRLIGQSLACSTSFTSRISFE